MSGKSKDSISIMRMLLKLCFYREWYMEMNAAERISDIGIWVRERIDIYNGIIHDIEAAVPRYYGPVGNYNSPFFNQ